MDYGDITGSFSLISCVLYFGGLLQMNSFDKLPIKLFFLKRTLCLEYIWKHHASHHENQQPEKKRKNLELFLNNKLNMFCFWIKNRGKYSKMWRRTRNEDFCSAKLHPYQAWIPILLSTNITKRSIIAIAGHWYDRQTIKLINICL